MSTSSLRTLLCLVALTAATQADADDFSWKASRTIRVPRSTPSARLKRAEQWQRIRQIENQVRLAEAEVRFWQRQLEDYEVFRFSDAIRPARDAAMIELMAAEFRLEAAQSYLHTSRQRRR